MKTLEKNEKLWLNARTSKILITLLLIALE